MLGWDCCCCLLPLIWRRERFPHKHKDGEWQRKEARGENARSSASCEDTEPQCVLLTYLYNAWRSVWGCRVESLFSLSPLNLTQLWNFLNAPLGITVVAFTATICLHPRPVRACAKPEAGVSPPRRSPLLPYRLYMYFLETHDDLASRMWYNDVQYRPSRKKPEIPTDLG